MTPMQILMDRFGITGNEAFNLWIELLNANQTCNARSILECYRKYIEEQYGCDLYIRVRDDDNLCRELYLAIENYNVDDSPAEQYAIGKIFNGLREN